MSDIEKFYDLGYKHGYEMAKLDMRIEKLNKEIAELNNEATGFLERQVEKAESYRDSLREDGIAV